MVRRFLSSLLVLGCTWASTFSPLPAYAGSTLQRIHSSGTLRVCIWPDYYGITWRNPRTGQLSGIDIEISALLAQELGVKLQYVETTFARLIEDVSANRCDIAMQGVGVTPERQKRMAFSQPYLRSSIYGVTTRSNRVIRQWGDIDQKGVLVAVQAGTFMEPVMTDALKNATLVIVKPPTSREDELAAGRVDVFMTDYPYSRRLLDNADWARLVSPPQLFHPVSYAYAMAPGDDDWLSQVDKFLIKIKRDGRLEAAARRAGLSEIVVLQ